MDKENLIQSLIEGGYLKTPRVIEAFRKTDRRDFMPEGYKDLAYVDEAFSIGYGQTISQPRTVAFMFELLQPKAGDKVLDIGSGSGWTTALLAEIVGEKGSVIGVERISELVDFGNKNLAKYKFENARIVLAGRELGWLTGKPYDKILISAAAESIPHAFVDQLKIGGKIVIPIGHSILKIDRISKEKTKQEEYFGFSFVPLVVKK